MHCWSGVAQLQGAYNLYTGQASWLLQKLHQKWSPVLVKLLFDRHLHETSSLFISDAKETTENPSNPDLS